MSEAPWIAVIEDDVDLAEELINAIGAKGFRCVNSRDAADAKTKLRKQKFACVVLDINLEKGTGDQIVAELRNAQHINHSTPVIVISSHLDQDLVIKIRDHIAGAFVKPFLTEKLLEKIVSSIKGK